jgi:hypothetical protein
MQLRFASLAVVSSRRDFHPQECAHAGRTTKKLAEASLFKLQQNFQQETHSHSMING